MFPPCSTRQGLTGQRVGQAALLLLSAHAVGFLYTQRPSLSFHTQALFWPPLGSRTPLGNSQGRTVILDPSEPGLSEHGEFAVRLFFARSLVGAATLPPRCRRPAPAAPAAAAAATLCEPVHKT